MLNVILLLHLHYSGMVDVLKIQTLVAFQKA